MTQLLTLLDRMRTEGYVVTLPGSGGHPAKWIVERPSKLEWDLFSQVEPFVFSPEPAFDRTESARVAINSWKGPGYDTTAEIDAPFRVFSVEYLGGGPLDFFPIRGISGDARMKGGFLPTLLPEEIAPKMKRETLCILTIEIEPKQYGYYALCRDTDGTMIVFKSNMEGETVEALLQRLGREKIGVESVRTKVKIGVGKEKRFHKIRRIVHVWPKKLVKARESMKMDRHIDWSHRWEVRGHWRRHDGLGKDRVGDYCVQGWTWVVNYEKGPDHLPLVKKTRLVETEEKKDE